MNDQTTAAALAEALRALYPLVPFDGWQADETMKGKQLADARAALARYDRETGAADYDKGR